MPATGCVLAASPEDADKAKSANAAEPPAKNNFREFLLHLSSTLFSTVLRVGANLIQTHSPIHSRPGQRLFIGKTNLHTTPKRGPLGTMFRSGLQKAGLLSAAGI